MRDGASYLGPYRPEIDGLRAFAVVAVIINHIDRSLLPGGYLGVDVFYVISGYVITASLAKRRFISLRAFLMNFYQRRVRRLLPALMVFVMVAAILIGLVAFSPQGYLRAGALSLLGISNIGFYLEAVDYFNATAEFNPFMHTWSLGVEEQFYLVFPFLFWISGCLSSWQSAIKLAGIMLVLMVLSLIGFVFLYEVNQPAAYFLMPFRFWELAAGVLLFLTVSTWPVCRLRVCHWLCLLAAAGIVGLALLPVEPNAAAYVAIVLMTSALLYAIRPGMPIFHVLTAKWSRRVGDLSYSLYLWHGGILALARQTIGIHWWSVPPLLIGIIGLSILSYRLVETPLRNHRWSHRQWPTLAIALSSMFAGATLLDLLARYEGVLSLYTGNRQQLSQVKTAAKEYTGEFTGIDTQACRNPLKSAQNLAGLLPKCLSKQADQKAAKLIFVGDSHSGMLMPLADMLWKLDGVAVLNLYHDGCTLPASKLEDGFCKRMEKEVLALSRQLPGKKVFIVSSNYMESVDFVRSTGRFARDLIANGGYVVIVVPGPTYPSLEKGVVADGMCSLQWFRPAFALGEACLNGHAINWRRRRYNPVRLRYLHALESLGKDQKRVYIYDPFEQLCVRAGPDRSLCRPYVGSTLLYYDDNHLSIAGAQHLYPSFRAFLKAHQLL